MPMDSHYQKLLSKYKLLSGSASHLKAENERIEKKLSAFKEINKTKSEVVATVSHELRAPLSIIKEALMLISDKTAGPINSKQKNLLTKGAQNVERLRRIIDELLDVARIEKGTLHLYYSLINFNDLIADSSKFFKKSAKERSIRLSYHLPKEQINIFIDPQRMSQVISNLINNAIKFTGKGGQIKVETKILDDRVRVGIIDTGIGIAKQDLPDIFKKFVQVSKSADAEKKGLGLGLPIAKDLVERHGGEIWAESKLGTGSSFYFTVPKFYITKALDKNIRKRINELLEKSVTSYLVNLSIINFKEFKTRFKSSPRKLFKDLGDIIETTFRELSLPDKHRPQIILEDYRNGVYSFIYPNTTEERTSLLCESLKDKIRDYLSCFRIDNVFINVGALPYPPEKAASSTQKLLANLYIKKIYIGAEIRRFVRVNYQANIEVLLQGNRTESSQTIDISEGGICFISEAPLKTDAKINIKLELFPKKRHFYAEGRVAWIKTMETFEETERKYKIGVQFAYVPKTDKRSLARLIKSISS